MTPSLKRGAFFDIVESRGGELGGVENIATEGKYSFFFYVLDRTS
jgi:hypothetical protein